MRLFRQYLFALIVVLAAPFYAQAAGQLQLPSATIEWQEGDLNPDTLNGLASGIMIQFDDGRNAYADTLEIATTPAGESLRIDTLQASNFTMEDGAETLAFTRLNWSGAVIEGQTNDVASLLAESIFAETVVDFGEIEILGFNLLTRAGENISIDRFFLKTSPVTVAALPDVPLHAGDMLVENMVLVPSTEDPDRADYHAFLEAIGQKNLSIDVSMASNVGEAEDRVNSDTTMVVSVNGMGEIRLFLDMGMLNASLMTINSLAMDHDSSVGDHFLSMLMTGLFFNAAEISIRDTGFLPIVLEAYANENGMDIDQASQNIMDLIALSVGSYAPQTYTSMAPEVEKFLEQGGMLELTMKPFTPVPITSFITFAAVPDTAVSVLGMEIRHRP